MSKKLEDIRIGDTFDIKEAVELTDDAARRTRWVTIVLMVATVIIFIGFYNSTEWSWAYHRLQAVYENEYIAQVNSGGDKPERRILDAFFGENDFTDYKGFACRIYEENKNPQNNAAQRRSATFSRYLFDRFNAKTEDRLKAECEGAARGEKSSKQLIKSLNLELNTILKDKFLSEKNELFKDITLGEETKNYLRLKLPENAPNASGQENNSNAAPGWNAAPRSLRENDLIRLNRLLMEDVYRNDEQIAHILENRDIIPVDGDDQGNVVTPEQKRRLDRQYERIRAYVDNVQYIRIPVIGIAIDTNDLGTLGGLSLAIIFLLLRYSLSREIKNLNISFKEAFCHDKLSRFYHALAMLQVFTVPEMKGEKKNKVLSVIAKLILLSPFVVILLGSLYDYYSVYWLKVYEPGEAALTLTLETMLLFIILPLAVRCIERQRHIDGVWNDYYAIIKSGEKPDVLVSDEFEKSGDKKLVAIIKKRITADR